MTVLGLAGHVDHGKTALVRALTGIDTDRLPEEKARGMTTDLGFASLRLVADGAPVELGVVDVPGHERYIRNMAAGAWGVDLCLLVVAADDGWMAQTETHARVLASFGPPRLLPVVTKIDKVEAGRAEAAAGEAYARALAVLGPGALVPSGPKRVARVSARSGDGLELLSRAIAAEASALEQKFRSAVEAGSRRARPYLFVDRVFTKQGSGVVVCGTLRGGAVASGEDLTLLPSGERVRVRGVGSLGEAGDEAAARSRAAFNLAGLKTPVFRGDLLAGAGAEDILVSDEFLARLEPGPFSDGRRSDLSRLSRETEVELVVGSAVRICRCIPVGKGPFARLICRERLAVPDDARAALVRHGGAELLCALRFVSCGAADRRRRRETAAALADLSEAPLALLKVVLSTRLEGWSPVPPAVESSLSPEALVRCGAARLGGFFVSDRLRAKAAETIRRLSAQPGGLDRAALPSALGVPRALAEELARASCAAPGGREADAEALPPALARAAALLKEAGSSGFDAAGAFQQPGRLPSGPRPTRAEIDALCKLSLAVPLDRTLFLHADVYRELVSAALTRRRIGDRLAIAEVKDATGFSRKYALPFLNRMERDGYVERDGDDRIVKRTPSAP